MFSQADGPQEVFAADVDGDGDIDIVSASKNDDRIACMKTMVLLTLLFL